MIDRTSINNHFHEWILELCTTFSWIIRAQRKKNSQMRVVQHRDAPRSPADSWCAMRILRALNAHCVAVGLFGANNVHEQRLCFGCAAPRTAIPELTFECRTRREQRNLRAILVDALHQVLDAMAPTSCTTTEREWRWATSRGPSKLVPPSRPIRLRGQMTSPVLILSNYHINNNWFWQSQLAAVLIYLLANHRQIITIIITVILVTKSWQKTTTIIS